MSHRVTAFQPSPSAASRPSIHPLPPPSKTKKTQRGIKKQKCLTELQPFSQVPLLPPGHQFTPSPLPPKRKRPNEASRNKNVSQSYSLSAKSLCCLQAINSPPPPSLQNEKDPMRHQEIKMSHRVTAFQPSPSAASRPSIHPLPPPSKTKNTQRGIKKQKCLTELQPFSQVPLLPPGHQFTPSPLPPKRKRPKEASRNKNVSQSYSLSAKSLCCLQAINLPPPPSLQNENDPKRHQETKMSHRVTAFQPSPSAASRCLSCEKKKKNL